MKTSNNTLNTGVAIKSSKVDSLILIIGFIAAFIILLNGSAMAQSTTGKHKKAQVTFLYPLGSNGMARDYSHQFSFNMLFGMNGGVRGFELGGIGNYNDGDVSGFQLAGTVNVNKGATRGVQLSGTANINMGPTRGFQLAVANIVQGEAEGMQLGVLNTTTKLKGVQLGVVNIAGERDGGIPIGIINVVKNGYYAIETTGGEALYANVNFKMGVEQFYTIFKLGYSSFNDEPIYSYGLGFGTLISLKDRHQLSVDISSNAIVYDNNWSDVWDEDLNVLNKLDVNYRYQLTPKLSLMAGPSLNVYTTRQKIGDSFGTLDIPGGFHTSESDDKKTTMWIGINAGLSLRL